MAKIIPGTLTSTGMDMSFAQINIFHDDISITYLVPSNAAANEVIKVAFGEKRIMTELLTGLNQVLIANGRWFLRSLIF